MLSGRGGMRCWTDGREIREKVGKKPGRVLATRRNTGMASSRAHEGWQRRGVGGRKGKHDAERRGESKGNDGYNNLSDATARSAREPPMVRASRGPRDGAGSLVAGRP